MSMSLADKNRNLKKRESECACSRIEGNTKIEKDEQYRNKETFLQNRQRDRQTDKRERIEGKEAMFTISSAITQVIVM